MSTSLTVGQTVSLVVRCTNDPQHPQPPIYRPGDLIPAFAEVHKHRSFEALSLHGSLVGTSALPILATATHQTDMESHPGETRVWNHPADREDLYQTMIHTHLNQQNGFSYALPSINNSSGREATVMPITFVLPELVGTSSHKDSSTNNGNNGRMPPSCEAGALYVDPWGRSYMQPLIEYYLQVTLRFRLPGETAIRTISAKHKIRITTAPHNDPPTYSQDAVAVQGVTAAADVRRSRFAKPFARLSVAMAEPLPIVGRNAGGGGQAIGQLNIAWAPSSEAYDEFELGDRSVKIEYQLQSWTRYRTRAIRPGDQNISASEEPKPHRSMETTHLGTFEVRAADRDNVCLDVEEGQGRSHSGTIPIPIQVEEGMVPTFSSLLASRDYLLLVKVKIQGLQHDALSLRVPVQICESVASKDGGNAQTKPPTYGDMLTSEVSDPAGC